MECFVAFDYAVCFVTYGCCMFASYWSVGLFRWVVGVCFVCLLWVLLFIGLLFAFLIACWNYDDILRFDVAVDLGFGLLVMVLLCVPVVYR